VAYHPRPVRVRDATPRDAPAICRVHEAAIAAFGPDAYDDAQVAAWRGDRSAADYEVGADGERWLVAERGGALAGFGVVVEGVGEEFGVESDAEVQAVYVHPEAARSGVGTALLAALEGHAREFGADDAALHASLNAVGFYERRGYERVAERDHEFGDGVTGTVVEMRTEL
jgi:putative acetyltransferase